MDDRQALIDALERHRKALTEQIAWARERVATETERLAELQLKLESVLQLMRIEGLEPLEGGAPGARHFVEVAYDILLEEGPKHYTELTRALGERGVLVPGQRPEMNLLAHIARDKRFRRTGRGRYAVTVSRPPTDRQPVSRKRASAA